MLCFSWQWSRVQSMARWKDSTLMLLHSNLQVLGKSWFQSQIQLHSSITSKNHTPKCCIFSAAFSALQWTCHFRKHDPTHFLFKKSKKWWSKGKYADRVPIKVPRVTVITKPQHSVAALSDHAGLSVVWNHALEIHCLNYEIHRLLTLWSHPLVLAGDAMFSIINFAVAIFYFFIRG